MVPLIVTTLNRGHPLLIRPQIFISPHQRRPPHCGHNFLANRVAVLEKDYCIVLTFVSFYNELPHICFQVSKKKVKKEELSKKEKKIQRKMTKSNYTLSTRSKQIWEELRRYVSKLLNIMKDFEFMHKTRNTLSFSIKSVFVSLVAFVMLIVYICSIQ